MKAANLLLRFLLELCALAAVSYAGYHAVEAEGARLALSIAAPILFATLWGLFAAHKSKFPPPQPWVRGMPRTVVQGQHERAGRRSTTQSREGGVATPRPDWIYSPGLLKAVIGAVLLEVTPGVLAWEGQGLWAAVIAVVIAANSWWVRGMPRTPVQG